MRKMGFKILIPALLLAAVILPVLRGQIALRTMSPQQQKPLQLILDAGHGGEDGGAVSCTGVPESQINLSITLKTEQLLGLYGVVPELIRREDISLHSPDAATLRQKKTSDLHNRVNRIEETEGAVLISVHQNNFPKANYHGAQVFYRESQESQELASILQEKLRRVDPENERAPGKISEKVYLMKHIHCPAALIECGFLSNPEEEARLRDTGYQSCLAACIVGGWLEFQQMYGGGASGAVL